MKSKKKELVEELVETLNYQSEEQIQLLIDIANFRQFANKKDLIKFAVKDESKMNYDTAYPQPYADSIREIYPNFVKGNFIFDYTEKTFGELVNINDLVVNRILNTKKY